MIMHTCLLCAFIVFFLATLHTVIFMTALYMLQVMVHTEFSDNVDQFPYNVNDSADAEMVLEVSKHTVILY